MIKNIREVNRRIAAAKAELQAAESLIQDVYYGGRYLMLPEEVSRLAADLDHAGRSIIRIQCAAEKFDRKAVRELKPAPPRPVEALPMVAFEKSGPISPKTAPQLKLRTP